MSARPMARARAIRALAERAYPTLELLSDATGRSLTRLRSTAFREGWNLGDDPSQNFEARIRPIVAKLLDQIEKVSERAAREDGTISRSEIEGVFSMVRALDKISEFARPEEVASNNQKREDEELAAVLDRINARIIELARALAAQMVEQRCRDCRCLSPEG